MAKRVKKHEVPDVFKSLYGSVHFCKYSHSDFMPAEIRDPLGLPTGHASRKAWEKIFQDVSGMLLLLE
jgi:hypothetical protein